MSSVVRGSAVVFVRVTRADMLRLARASVCSDNGTSRQCQFAACTLTGRTVTPCRRASGTMVAGEERVQPVLECIAQHARGKERIGIAGEEASIAAPEGDETVCALADLTPRELALSFLATEASGGDEPAEVGVAVAVTAAWLVDRLLPEAGYRQWVLTFPWTMRFRLAADRRLLTELLRVFLQPGR